MYVRGAVSLRTCPGAACSCVAGAAAARPAANSVATALKALYVSRMRLRLSVGSSSI